MESVAIPAVSVRKYVCQERSDACLYPAAQSLPGKIRPPDRSLLRWTPLPESSERSLLLLPCLFHSHTEPGQRPAPLPLPMPVSRKVASESAESRSASTVLPHSLQLPATAYICSVPSFHPALPHSFHGNRYDGIDTKFHGLLYDQFHLITFRKALKRYTLWENSVPISSVSSICAQTSSSVISRIRQNTICRSDR